MARARVGALIARAIAPLKVKASALDRYAPTWIRLRNARVAFFAPFLAAVLLKAVPGARHGTLGNLLIEVLAVLSALGAVAGIVVIYGMKCPRCSRRFTFNGGWTEFWTSRCCWCGLKQGTPSSLDEAQGQDEGMAHQIAGGGIELPNDEIQRTKPR